MFVKYSLGIQAPSVICLVGWITFIPQFFCATTICSPPDFPEGGNYTPVYTEYEVGMKVSYYCFNQFTRFGEDRITCQSTGRWSERTPFCDSPVKLKNPTVTTRKEGSQGPSAITDGSPNTCVTTLRGTSESVTVHLDRPAAVFAVIMYLTKGRSTFTISLSDDGHRKLVPCETHNAELAENDWVTFYCTTKDVKAKYITVQVSDAKASSLSLCEIEVYAKEDDWCQDPPENYLPNSQLQVSRSRADFKCNAGFKPKDSRRIYASCESNRWSRLPVQCVEILCVPLIVQDSSEGIWDIEGKTSKLSVGTKSTLKCKTGYHTEGEPTTVTCLQTGKWNNTKAVCKKKKPQKDSKSIIAGVVGTIVVLIIFVLLGLTIYFVRKKSREVVVIYKPSEDNSYSTPPSVGGQSIAGLSEAEYSTVYYEAIQNSQFAPKVPPPKPPNFVPKLDREYSKPIDDRSTYNTTPTNQNPTDLAFGTLTKSSSLYSSMN